MPRAFISYVSEDKTTVLRLCNDLTRNGVEVWLDRKDIKPGYRWKNAIREAIQEGDFFIACFSTEYQNRNKTYMNEELTLAIDELRQYPSDRVWFIPVLLSECDIPARSIGAGETLHDLQYIELYKNWTLGIEHIINVIRPIPAEVKRLIEMLFSHDPKVRRRTAQELYAICDARVVPELLKSREILHGYARDLTLDIIASFGVSAVPFLIREIDNRNRYVRKRAINSLSSIQRPMESFFPWANLRISNRWFSVVCLSVETLI